MSYIVCLFDALDSNANVFKKNDYDDVLEPIGTVDVLKAGASLIDIAQTYSANKIHVLGPEDFLSPIIEDMMVLNFKRNSNIEIEVN